MSDPSTPDNAYYLNNLTTNSVERIEVLKGQSHYMAAEQLRGL